MMVTMINEERFEKLLAEDESNYLEFKEELDLQSNGSKAKFLREVLSLANTPIRNGYIIIGVEDKTKVLVGLKNKISEEQIQQVVSEWCHPPIKCSYQNIEYKHKTIGVVEVFPLRPPYTLKKRTGYEESSENSKKPEKVNLRENQVFIRRGSTIGEATIDEVLEMSQSDAKDLSDVVSQLDYMNETLERIASRTAYLRNMGSREESNEIAETIFVSVISALVLGFLWNPTSIWLSVTVMPIVVVCMVILSMFRIIHLGLIRTISSTVLIGIALTVWMEYGSDIGFVQEIMAESRALGILSYGFIGTLIGLVCGIFLMLWGPSES